ncbi:hypothetical protein D3C84_477200 [compost metagenome]
MIRPKSYNIIARSVIAAGVVLVLSQTNLAEALVISIYENFFSKSEVLRAFLDQGSSQWLGFILILAGFIYHFSMTVGQELVTLKLQSAPKLPELKLEIFDADSNLYIDNIIKMRGAICIAPRAVDIPTTTEAIDNINVFGVPLSNIMSNIGSHSINRDYYKDRAKFLNTWGGAELIRFALKNTSVVFAKNVSISMRINKTIGVSADNTNNDLPTLPSEKNDHFGAIAKYTNTIPNHYSIKSSHNDSEYIFTWKAGDIQANTKLESSTLLFLRVERDTEIIFNICCDDLPEPITLEYQIIAPTTSKFNVSVEDLKSDDAEFDSVLRYVMMNGYLNRRIGKTIDRINHEQQEHLP